MKALYKAAYAASFIVMFGMLVHLMNAFWLEPTYLGFVDPSKDYADMAKIQNAFESCSINALHLCSFTYSGYAHMINGLMILLLAVATREAFRDSNPVLAQLMYVGGFVSGLGFLATGINDIPGSALSALLREQNPDFNTAILLMVTTIRSVVNIIAITGLGLFAALVGRAALLSGRFSKWGAWFGFILLVPGIGGLINPVFGFTYLSFVPIWMIWLGLQFKGLAARS